VTTARDALVALATADRYNDLDQTTLATLLNYIAPGDYRAQTERFDDLRAAVRTRDDFLAGAVDWAYIDPDLRPTFLRNDAALATIDEQITDHLDALLRAPYLPYDGAAAKARPITDVPTGGLL
jgi:hypothetical protein